ncbi:heparan-alpha-glucosaminide N-acetyltransferase [Ostreiculturibacter nitratireducens]|uniref:DUF1624 domain-containing protein n=1 Tax=Ostreiculturibacter nitratireducens TaxID=3075226 RepID=UPI0031B5FA53
MQDRQRSQGRIPALDLARSAALVGMIVYHAVYDLTLFGFLAPGTAHQTIWLLFARLVAGSFLFVAGMSLHLAHGQGIQWNKFFRRIVILIVAAAAITVATYYLQRPSYVFFGILHSIAAASVIGLAFLRLPPLFTIAVAAFALVAPQFMRSEAFDAPYLLWLGLSSERPSSMDFEPIFPWLGPFLLGLACSKLFLKAGIWDALRRGTRDWGRGLGILVWPGRHSLGIYLIHQPVLFGVLYAAARFLR